MECFLAKGGDVGLLNTIQAIWIKSNEGPIKQNDITHALHHVATKTQILQLCVQSHHTRPWFKRMRSVDVDFKTEVGDVMEIYYKTLEEPYNMKEGPLWRARLVNQSGDGSEAVLMIAVQHALTDGYTNMILARDVITTLNASLTGRHLEVPVRPIIPPIMDEMFSFKHYPFIVYAYVKKCYETFIIGYDKKLTFNGVYKTPTNTDVKLKNLHGELTEDQTNKLIQHCKKNGVTVHSCIYAALHTAYLKMAQEMSTKKIDSAQMQASDTVNVRRYYSKTYSEDSGCHVSVIENELLIKDSHITTHKGFWELVHQVADNLNYRLNVEISPIKRGPLFRLTACITTANSLKNYFGGSQYTDNHFVTSNMGNLKNLLPANPGDGPVEITSLLRSMSGQYLGFPFLVAMHTFRGKFMYSLDLYTNKMPEDVFNRYFTIFSQMVDNIADVGSVA
ncbi:unnamed protein product [Meganyctiphanes norvegica]|uniref:Diacylglycerol O-acyltransferase n=1 Tax=Meganyctiphanes norvegica TaxID=48144 RepID=A0AAV2RXJ4_MEGNR